MSVEAEGVKVLDNGRKKIKNGNSNIYSSDCTQAFCVQLLEECQKNVLAVKG